MPCMPCIPCMNCSKLICDGSMPEAIMCCAICCIIFSSSPGIPGIAPGMPPFCACWPPCCCCCCCCWAEGPVGAPGTGGAAEGPAGGMPGIMGMPPFSIISNLAVSAFWSFSVLVMVCWRRQYVVHVNSSKP